MLSYLKGWNAPRIKALIAQTPSETILLSHIYERCLPRHSELYQLPMYHDVSLMVAAITACMQLIKKASSLSSRSDSVIWLPLMRKWR